MVTTASPRNFDYVRGLGAREAFDYRSKTVVADIIAAGVPAYYEPDATAIVAKLNPLLKPGDVVVVFSNGGFGGIHQKLLA